MRQKIVIVGCGNSIGLAFALQSIQQIHKQQIEIVIAEDKKLEEIRNKAFEPEPLQIHNFNKEWFEPKVNDIPRNKYFDKPRNNFKKL